MEFKILCLFQIKKSYTSAMHYILFGYCLEARPKELEMILDICAKLSCQGREVSITKGGMPMLLI
jgi:hypothetical protein